MTRHEALGLAGALWLGVSALAMPALAQEGETLNVGIVSDPVTLDPALMASFFELSVQYNIHEPLLHVTPELVVEPGLASVETVDPTTYAFELREGLTFHDGMPLNAEAAKANFDRMLDVATGSPRRGELGPIEAVEVTGERTFTITMSEPYAPFLQVLANRAGMMVSPTAVAELGEDFASQAVGAGPYRVASWTRNSELVLEAFPDYWRGAPEIERVVFRPIADETVRLTNLRSGAVQLIDQVPPQVLQQLQGEAGIEVSEQAGLGFNAFSMNTTRAPFDDADLRKAMLNAVDPAAIQQAVYFGTGTVSYGPISPAQGWAYDPDFRPYAFSPDEARALIEGSGTTSPVPVTITVTNSPAQVRTAEIVQALASQVGFQIDIRQIDSASLITTLREADFDMAMSPWSGRADPDGNMFNYFTIGGSNNFAKYENEEVDRLLREARSETEESARRELYREAEAQIAEDAPLLFLNFPAILQASTEALGWVQYPDGSFRLQFATLR